MKYDSILKLSVLGLLSAFFGGCDDAEYSTIENLVYISEAAPADKYNQQIENLTVKGDTKAAIHVQLAQPLDRDIRVRLGIDPNFAEEYNRKNGTNYTVLPDEYLSYTEETTIPAGIVSSDAVEINIGAYPTDNGAAYCVPLHIVSSDGPVAVSQSSSRILYLLSTPLMQVVPTMRMPDYQDNGAHAVSPNWNIETRDWTLEGWIWVKEFGINNQAIWKGTMGTNEIYIRFGDADVAWDKLQIKTAGSQFNSNMTFEPETWYHIAFVNGNGKCTLYINGSEDSSMSVSASDYTINGLEFLCGWFNTECKMAQVRFWKKALSQSTIQDAMSRQVPASSDGLFGYWKLDEGNGNVFKDATSNGFDLQYTSGTPGWSAEKVDFSDPNR